MKREHRVIEIVVKLIMVSNYNNVPTMQYIGISDEPCHPTNILWTDEPRKGRVLYTGNQLHSRFF